MTAYIKFNRIVAKLNFKYSDRKDLKQAIEKSLLSETGLIVSNNRQMISNILNRCDLLKIHYLCGDKDNINLVFV